MFRKKLIKALLYPHMIVMALLLPVSVLGIIMAMTVWGSALALSIIAYVVSAYTLTVWCVKAPSLVRGINELRHRSRLIKRLSEDARLRETVVLYTALIINALFALFYLALGMDSGSFWYCSLSVYYLILAVIRLFLARYTVNNIIGERIRAELICYRACGIALLLLNTVLAVIIFFMVYFGRSFAHGDIMTITVAAITFTSLTVAIINTVRYRKYKSPVFSASKAVSLASATVSLITLEATMLTAFGDGSADALMLGFTGGAASSFILAEAVYIIVSATKKIKTIDLKDKNNG